jgi:hypothetical protein
MRRRARGCAGTERRPAHRRATPGLIALRAPGRSATERSCASEPRAA